MIVAGSGFKPGPGFGRLEPAPLGTLQRAVLAGGVWLAFQVKNSLNVGNRDGSQPSAPGEPPRKQTARLFKSITQVVETTPSAIVLKVGTNVEYARHLEMGTSRMAPRPYLRPALLNNRTKVVDVILKAARSGGGSASPAAVSAGSVGTGTGGQPSSGGAAGKRRKRKR